MADGNDIGRVLVVVWPHEQPPKEALPPVEPPRVPGTATHERREKWSDPVWDALTALRDERGRSWDRKFASVVTELELRSLVVETRETRFHPRPRLEGRWGQIFTREGSMIDLFRSELSLNTDGPTVPSLRMLELLLEERRPRLVISIGVGGGVRGTDQIGDVVVTTRARFELRGDLRTYELNDQPFGGTASVEAEWFTGIELGELQELPLLPASPGFRQPPNGWPQPAAHLPTIRTTNDDPVVTRPAVDAPAFIPATADKNREDFLGNNSAAVDMDAAVAAKACQDARVSFVAVIGISVPALVPLPVDWEGNLRDAWATTYNRQFAADAARNAVTVIERLVERMAV